MLCWHGITPGKQAQEIKVSRLLGIFQLNTPPPQVKRWTAEDDARLQNLKEKEISLNDTVVGRKKIVLKQQLNAARLSMSTRKWKQLVELRKQKWGEEEVIVAAEDVIEATEEVSSKKMKI